MRLSVVCLQLLLACLEYGAYSHIYTGDESRNNYSQKFNVMDAILQIVDVDITPSTLIHDTFSF